METLEEKLKKVDYRNWVKATLGLGLTKNALQEYTYEKFDLYVKGGSKLKAHQSFFTNEELNHIKLGFGSLRTNLKKSVHFKNNIWVWTSKDDCSGTHLCRTSFEKIAGLHRKYDIKHKGLSVKEMYWENSDTSSKLSLPWAIAKMFMPRGNTDVTKPDDTDPAAMFHIMIVCDLFDTNTIRVSRLEGLKKARNELYHSSDNELKTTIMEKYFDHMEGLLSDASEDQCASQDIRQRIKAHIAKIIKLKSCELSVSVCEDAERQKQTCIDLERKRKEKEEQKAKAAKAFKEKQVKRVAILWRQRDVYKEKAKSRKEELEAHRKEWNAAEIEYVCIIFIITVAFAFILKICAE